MSEKRIYEAFGRRVAVRRRELGLTQADLARRIRMSRASVANIESGRQNVLLHHVYALAEGLELPAIAVLLPPPPRPLPGETHDIEFEATIPRDQLSDAERLQVGDWVAGAMAKRPAKGAA